MSIKLHNGYLLNFKTLDDAFKFLKSQKPHFKQIANKIKLNWVAWKCIEYLESGKCNEIKENTVNIIQNLDWKFGTLLVEHRKQNYRNPDIDIDISWCLFPSDIGILCLLYSEQEKYDNYWESLKEVKEYQYYNNTDCPKNISEEEWEKRYEIWDKAFNFDFPSTHGLILDLFGKYECPDKVSEKEVADLINSGDFYQKRLNSKIRQKLDNLYSKNFIDENGKFDHCGYFEFYSKIPKEEREYLKSQIIQNNEVMPITLEKLLNSMIKLEI